MISKGVLTKMANKTNISKTNMLIYYHSRARDIDSIFWLISLLTEIHSNLSYPAHETTDKYAKTNNNTKFFYIKYIMLYFHYYVPKHRLSSWY